MSLVINMMDIAGMKMMLGGKGSSVYNEKLRGMFFINNMIIYTIGFTLIKSNELADGVTTIISYSSDFKVGALVILLTTVLTLTVGGLSSCVLAKMESIRNSPLHEMLFILFITYFLSSIAYMDEKWDYISEELAILMFGVFYSKYTKYNVSISSTSRFR